MATHPPIALVFAATDPTGGAGLQADVLTLAAHGCHPVSVATALTVQDTHGVRNVQAVESRWVEQQARALLEELQVAAFKLGVLGSAENVAVIAAILAENPDVPVVLDPVLASARGDVLASDATITALREQLLARTTVLTPNSREARQLAGCPETCELAECAQRLISLGSAYVLITGTHEPGAEVVNTLYGAAGALHVARWERLAGSFHGSGCTLASAIAAQLAIGLEVPEAVRAAQAYTWRSLASGFRPGSGQALPDRFFWARDMRHEMEP